ncbi:MAG: PQQ-dependent sugar dehydrogenase [Verrucomicrobia bacterium]|nr:PQQ-dependent sugar dehydrogenase [Verrucomicrobiota bacterium]
MLVADQIGRVHVLTKDGTLLEKPFLDLTDRVKINPGAFDERGLLGLALHPRFRENRKFYIVYSAPLRKDGPAGWDHTMQLSELKVSAGDGNCADPASERVLLQIDEPYFNHNAGCIVFGPDGYLYMAVGDGGNANDEGQGHSLQGNGQDLTNLMGKILRIDVDKGAPYAIPADNPFVAGHARPEIYAYGLRNPWRITFDRGGSHELFAADIGQTLYEEVNLIVKGGNYGWRIREGFHCFDPKNPRRSPEDCPKVGTNGKPLLDPIFAYKNVNGFRNDPEALGSSITGGYIYRGQAIPQLEGRYVFGDWSRNFVVKDGVMLVATRPTPGASKAWTIEPLDLVTHPKGRLKSFIVALGEDAYGELYVMTNDSNSLRAKTGKVYKLVPQ